MFLEIEEFSNRFKQNPNKSGFVLDFDGTLSQIVDRPGGAHPVAGSVELLEALSGKYRVVALVSGRRAEDLRRIVNASGLLYVGLYGAERLEDGEVLQPPEADRWRGMASRLARDAQALITTEGLTGAEVEYKDLAVSVHYRNAADPRAAEAIQTWALAAAPRRGFEAGVGRMVVEMRPEGISKASALEQIVRENELDFVVTAGDDFQDVDAMTQAKALLGDAALRIGVASDEEPAGIRDAADMMAVSAAEVRDLLKSFL